MEPKPVYNTASTTDEYATPDHIKRKTIEDLYKVTRRALVQNVADDVPNLERLLVGIERKTLAVLQSEKE